VTGNRSAPGQLATVKWDDEGVEPNEVTLVDQGVLNDFLTTRESAAWLAPYYSARGTPLRSHGCATASSAFDFPLVHPPNINMHPGRDAVTFDDMVKATPRGIAILDGNVSADFQGRSGVFNATNDIIGIKAREIVNGRLGAPIDNVGFLFRSDEIWKNLMTIGGAVSQTVSAVSSTKGEPAQTTWYSIGAVPVTVKNIAVIDMRRRA